MTQGLATSLLFFFPMELFSAVILYGVLLEKRQKFVLRFVIAILAAILSVQGVGLLWAFFQPTVTKTHIVSGILCMIIFVIMIFISWFTCEIRFQEAVYCATCAYLTEHMVYCIRTIIDHYSGKDIMVAGTPWYFLLHIVAYLTAYQVFVKRMIKDSHYATGLLQSLWVSVSTLFVVILMSIIASYYNFIGIHGIYALFSCLFVLISQVNQLNQLNLQKELDSNQQLWMKHKAQYEINRENIDIINRKSHDLKHQIAALRLIGDLEKQKEAIDAMENSILIYDSILETGNEILDTVLTEKSLICRENKIDMNCIIDGMLLNFMDTIDLYTLFGNALDNAIEGVLKLENTDQRAISILVHEKINLIFIQVENYYKGQLTIKNGLPVTEKTDKEYHGFGLKSMIHVAEKYGGFVNLETEHNIFVLRITIPRN